MVMVIVVVLLRVVHVVFYDHGFQRVGNSV